MVDYRYNKMYLTKIVHPKKTNVYKTLTNKEE